MFCERCGYRIKSEEDYCRWCGGAVGMPVLAAERGRYSSFAGEASLPGTRSFFEGLFTASGRINRRSLLFLTLGSFFVSIALAFLDTALGTYDADTGLGFLSVTFALASIWIAFAAYIKRLHDFEMGGWWVLLLFIPIVNLLWFLVLFLKGGTPGSNSYGQQPAPGFAL